MARIAENSVILDGIMYKPGQEIPDLGNWTCVKIEGGRHFYEGVSKELEPEIGDVYKVSGKTVFFDGCWNEIASAE